MFGDRPRLLLVHGSVYNGPSTWGAQEPLRELFDVEVLNRRGFPPGPLVAAVDFVDEADWLAPQLRAGDHLVGHSYGGIIATLAAARRPELLRSLAVLEPPAFGLARGHPRIEEIVARSQELWAEPGEPAPFLRAFLELVGVPARLPSPLPADLEQGTRLLMRERPPVEAEVPYALLAASPFPKLVVSGGHDAGYEAVCDALAAGIGARRETLVGAGHAVQRAPGFNELLVEFLESAAR